MIPLAAVHLRFHVGISEVNAAHRDAIGYPSLTASLGDPTGHQSSITIEPMKLCRFSIMSILLLVLAAACSSIGPGRTVLTGTKREPISPDQVRVYQVLPAHAEQVAMIMSEADGKGQGAVDKALVRIKARAASLGANGVILGGVNVNKGYVTYYGLPVAPGKSETGLNATAIYVRE